MKNKQTAQLVISAICGLLLMGCTKKASQEIDYGAVTNSVYKNEFFGLSVPLPASWSVQDQEMRKQLSQEGSKMLAGDDKQMKKTIEASEQQTIYLLAAFEQPVGAPVEFNPSIMCMAEKVRKAPGIKRGQDYLFHAKKQMEAGQIKFTFPKEISTEKIDGIDFDVMHTAMTVESTTVQQKYYATIMKRYALCFILSSNSAEQDAVLQKILESVTLNKK